MTKPYEEKKIKLSLLDLDKNNPRFLMLYKDSKNEEDIVRYLLNNENAIDIVKSIVNHKDYFKDSFCYVVEKDGRYVVKEGNRRLAALKALSEPEKYLDNKYQTFNIEDVPCLLYNNEKKLSERIVLRHTQLEVQRWSRLAQGAYIQTHLNIGGKLSDFSYLKDYKNVYRLFKFWEMGSELDGYNTKLIDLLITWERASIIERFFGRSDLLTKMGFEFNEDCSINMLNAKVFQNTLDCFLNWLEPRNKDITAHKINKKTIEYYFKEVFSGNGYQNPQLNFTDFKPEVVQTDNSDVNKKNENHKKETNAIDLQNNAPKISTENNIEQSKDTLEESNSKDYETEINNKYTRRKTLIPKTLPNIVPNEFMKTHLLFDELQTIDITKKPNCVAFGFRAFIEYSCKIYMEKIKDKAINKNEESNLSGNICSIAGELLQKGLITKGLNHYINRRYKDKICPLNDIVHGHNYPVNSEQLCMNWDAYQNLFVPLWTEISNMNGGG